MDENEARECLAEAAAAEEPNAAEAEAPSERMAGAQAEPAGGEAAEVDWKREARKWEDMAKRDKARADKAESKLAAAEAREARARLVAEAAREHSVDAELLAAMSGDTPEEVAANAAMLSERMAAMPRYPAVEDRGASAAPPATRESIAAIEDPGERIRARAQNIGMYGI